MAPFGIHSLLLAVVAASLFASCSSSSSSGRTTQDHFVGHRPAVLIGRRAVAPPEAPPLVHRAVAAANSIQGIPYQYGGGHGRPSRGLDCSGTVSYVLRSCGLLNGAACSEELRKYGASGPGKWISIYAKDGHTFMTIAGLRLDTTTNGNGHTGPRWNLKPRKVGGFKVRHPEGL